MFVYHGLKWRTNFGHEPAATAMGAHEPLSAVMTDEYLAIFRRIVAPAVLKMWGGVFPIMRVSWGSQEYSWPTMTKHFHWAQKTSYGVGYSQIEGWAGQIGCVPPCERKIPCNTYQYFFWLLVSSMFLLSSMFGMMIPNDYCNCNVFQGWAAGL